MKKALLLIIPIMIIHSCASYKTKYDSNVKDWESKLPSDEFPLDHTVYLIGDAGNSKLGEKSLALQLLERKLKTAPENSHVLFLGDNIYPNGLDGKKDVQPIVDSAQDCLPLYVAPRLCAASSMRRIFHLCK